MRTLIKNGTVVTATDTYKADLLVEDGKISQIGASGEVVNASRDALILITGRDLGRFRYRWRNWLASHGGEDRVRWLIDAMDHADVGMRARAVEELVLVTGVGYEQRRAVADRDECRSLAELYRAWARDHGSL